jgi:anti-sigma-K factor RskA
VIEMSHEQFEEAVALYAVGALDRQERQTLEAHLLTGCTACHSSLKEYRSVAGILPYALPPAKVPRSLKLKVLAARLPGVAPSEGATAAPDTRLSSGLRTEALLPSLLPSPSRVFSPAFAVVLAMLFAGAASYAAYLHWRSLAEVEQRQRVEAALQQETTRLASLQEQLTQQEQVLGTLREEFDRRMGNLGEVETTIAQQDTELGVLRAELALRREEVSSLRRALAQRDDMLAILRSPTVKVISLAGLEHAKTAGAFLLFDQESKKAFFYAFNMPPLPAGKTYQLWAILDKPVSAGTFLTDPGQKGRFVVRNVPDLTQVTKFAVSLEPLGGRPQPTGEIYLAGEL